MNKEEPDNTLRSINFENIAENFPFKTKLFLHDEDLKDLVVFLIKEIKYAIADKKYNYNHRAALHVTHLNMDYGPEIARKYYEQIKALPGSSWNADFYGATGISKAIDDIFGPSSTKENDFSHTEYWE